MPKLQSDILREWQKKYPDFTLVAELKSGKEADLWLVRIKSSLFALKVYVGAESSTRVSYTQGRWVSRSSLRKAIKQKTKVGKELQQRLWTKREYYLLKKLRDKGAIVPNVFSFTDTAILMEYLGDEHAAAPRLIDVVLDASIKPTVQMQIESSMKLFLDNGIVHADLSPYNILWWNNRPWIIDFPQAVDIRRNPNWQELYNRDLYNVRSYFM